MAEVINKARGQFKIDWFDFGREPTVESDKNFPKGKDLKLSAGPGMPRCKVELPYPAKRCGFFTVRCMLCRISMAITTAGRPDDPRSVEVPCKPVLN